MRNSGHCLQSHLFRWENIDGTSGFVTILLYIYNHYTTAVVCLNEILTNNRQY
jgi:hypothetical protein